VHLILLIGIPNSGENKSTKSYVNYSQTYAGCRSNTVTSKLKHTETESAALTSLSTGTPSAWHNDHDVLILEKRLGHSFLLERASGTVFIKQEKIVYTKLQINATPW